MSFERKIRQALTWMRLVALADGMARGGACAAAILFSLVLVAKLAPVALPGALFIAVAALTVAAAAVWVLLHRRPTPVRAALALDESHGLNERFLSAWHARGTSGPFREAILHDAEQHAPAVNPRRVARMRVTRPVFVCLTLAAAALLLDRYLPESDPFGLRRRRAAVAAERKAVHAESRKLEQVAQRLENTRRELALPETPQLARDFEEIKRQFAEGHAPSARDAMARLSSLSDRIEQQKQKLEKKAEAGVGGRAEREESQSRAQTSDLERALRRGDMNSARAALDRLARKAGAPGADPSEKARLGQELASLGSAVEGQPELSGGLGKAAEGLQKGDSASAQAGFEQARKALDSIAAAQRQIAEMERALQELEESKERLADAAAGESAGAAQAGGGDSRDGVDKGQSGEQGGEKEPGASASPATAAGKAPSSQTPSNGEAEPGAAGANGQGETAGNPQQGGQPESSGDHSAAGQAQSSASEGGRSSDSFTVGGGNSASSPDRKQNSREGSEATAGEDGEAGAGEPSQGGEPSGGGEQSGEGAEKSGGQQQGGEGGQAGSSSSSSAGTSSAGAAGGVQSQGGGQQGAGAAGASSSGQGKAGSAGQGSRGQEGGGTPDWGVGTTNLDSGSGYNPSARPPNSGDDRQTGRDSRWTEEFIRLYDPRVTQTNGKTERAKGKMGQGPDQFSVNVEGKPRREAPQSVPSQAFLDYREAQKDALTRENIPLGYKEAVRNYFDSIEPPADPKQP